MEQKQLLRVLQHRAGELRSVIPDSITLVEYLESDGNLYIDTGVVPNLMTFKAEIDYLKPTFGSWDSVNPTILGVASDSSTSSIDNVRLRYGGNSSDYFGLLYGNYKDSWPYVNYYDSTVLENEITNVVIENGALYINNTAVYKVNYIEQVIQDINCSGSLYMFALHIVNPAEGESEHTNHMIAKLGIVRMWNNDELVRVFHPALFGNTPCMWECVEGKAYFNLGTGNFTVGNVITYTPLEYLLSGLNKYIDFGYKPNTHKSEYRLGVEFIEKGTWGPIIDNEADIRFGMALSGSNLYGWVGKVGTKDVDYSQRSIEVRVGTKYDIVFNKSQLMVDNTSVAFEEKEEQQATFNAVLGGRHTSETNYLASRVFTGKFYYALILENSKIIYNFRPYSKSFIENSANITEMGMLDVRLMKFFTSTGDASYGETFAYGLLYKEASFPNTFEKLMVNWNLSAINGTFENTDNIECSCNISVSDNVLTLSGRNLVTNPYKYLNMSLTTSDNFTEGDKILISVFIKNASGSDTLHFMHGSFGHGGTVVLLDVALDEEFHKVNVIVEATAYNAVLVEAPPLGSYYSRHSINMKEMQVFNLTQMFGAGNEPTADQFASWVDLTLFEDNNPGISLIVHNGNLYNPN